MNFPLSAVSAMIFVMASSTVLVAGASSTTASSLRTSSVAEEGRPETDDHGKLYRLRMKFVERGSGVPLRGVTVVITRGNSAGEVRFDDCGPVFSVAAERGIYSVNVTYAGVTQTRSVDLREFPQDLTFYW